MAQRGEFLLGKDDRLKSKKAIEALFAAGKKISVPDLLMLWQNTNTFNGLKAGFSPSRKNFKKATDRNRVKRLMRECWRLQKNDLKSAVNERGSGLAVFFIYNGKALPVYKSLFTAFEKMMNRLMKIIIDENH